MRVWSGFLVLAEGVGRGGGVPSTSWSERRKKVPGEFGRIEQGGVGRIGRENRGDQMNDKWIRGGSEGEKRMGR